jgi:hypothetical protein
VPARKKQKDPRKTGATEKSGKKSAKEVPPGKTKTAISAQANTAASTEDKSALLVLSGGGVDI